jgi:alpha-glucosidase (family GH31 glycosyl hydrolase)
MFNMFKKSGNLSETLESCSSCGDATVDNLNKRNQQCMNVCGSRIKHGYTAIKPLCHCEPRTHIKPCDSGSDLDRKKCYLEQGYQYWDEKCTDNTGSGGSSGDSGDSSEYVTIGGPGLQTNDNSYIGCDYTFPYNNNIKLKHDTPFRSKNNFLFSKKDGGYIKYDKITNDIVHVSMNARQGGDDIGNVGILRTPSIDPKFSSEKLTNNDLSISVPVLDSANSDFSETDRLLESKLDNKFVDISKNNLHLTFDFFTCQYGYLRLKDADFKPGTYKYYIFGLGPLKSENIEDFSLNWANYTRRCNKGFGTEQGFGIHGSHWPVMYVLRVNIATQEQKCFSVYFDHFRKLEYFFDDLQSEGIIKIRTREPEFRFYVSIESDIVSLKKQFMKIVGSPQAPVQKAMGMWVGRFGYKNWNEVEKDIKRLQDKKFPIDGFINDLYWYGHSMTANPKNYIELDPNNYANNFCHKKTNMITHNEMGKFDWDREAFPEPEKYLTAMNKEQSYGMTLIEEPYLTADSKDFSYMFHNNMTGKTANGSWASPDAVWKDWIGDHPVMPDFSNPATAKYWFETRIKPRITDGTYFWWNDLGEPEVLNENALYLGVGQVLDSGEMMHEMYQAPEMANFTQFLWTKGICEEYSRVLNKRYNVLVRAGTCGIQRYGAFMWPGDTSSNTVDMVNTINNCLTLSLVGLDFSTSDAGGFNNSDEERKVYSRWFANSAAIHFNLKPHKWLTGDMETAAPSEWGNWENNLANVVERYLFSPYYYSTAIGISTFGENQGESFITTLFFKYQSDPLLLQDALENKNNALCQMVGPNLLYIMYKNYTETSRDIYLPKNTIWYDYRAQKWVPEGKHTLEMKNDRLPLFIKNNSIVPTRDTNDTVNMRFNDNLKVCNVYVYSYNGDKADPFVVYIDDGITMNKNQTKFEITFKNSRIKVNQRGGRCHYQPKFNFYLVSKEGTELIKYSYEPFSILGKPIPTDNKFWIILTLILLITLAIFFFFIKKNTYRINDRYL